MATAEVLERLAAPGDDEPLYEVIDGIKVELPPMSILAARVATRIHNSLQTYSQQHAKGESVVETLLRMPHVRRHRRPDVAFVSFDRWPADRPIDSQENAWDVVPDVAVEVVSPTDIAEDLLEKILEYLRAGVRAVWVVYPRVQMIHVYENPRSIRVYTAGDVLDGGDVLPGYRQAVAALFPPMSVVPMTRDDS